MCFSKNSNKSSYYLIKIGHLDGFENKGRKLKEKTTNDYWQIFIAQ